MFWPSGCWALGTTAPCAMRLVAAALEYMFAPVDVTVVMAVECTVYGPRTEPAGPLRWSGVIVRLGGGGWMSGPSLMTWFTIEATVLSIDSEVLST